MKEGSGTALSIEPSLSRVGPVGPLRDLYGGAGRQQPSYYRPFQRRWLPRPDTGRLVPHLLPIRVSGQPVCPRHRLQSSVPANPISAIPSGRSGASHPHETIAFSVRTTPLFVFPQTLEGAQSATNQRAVQYDIKLSFCAKVRRYDLQNVSSGLKENGSV